MNIVDHAMLESNGDWIANIIQSHYSLIEIINNLFLVLSQCGQGNRIRNKGFDCDNINGFVLYNNGCCIDCYCLLQHKGL